MSPRKRLVLIVGAGGSAPYGFPVGAELGRQIGGRSEEIARELVNLQCHRDTHAQRWWDSEKNAEATLTTALEKFERSGIESIDEYLGTKSGMHYGPVLAMAAAFVIATEEIRFAQGLRRTGDWHRELLLPLIPQLVEGGSGIEGLHIVTFNYDRSLELNAANMAYGFSGIGWDGAEKLAGALDVCHMHGTIKIPVGNLLPNAQSAPKITGAMLNATAASIRLVDQRTSEGLNAACSKTRGAIGGWLREADVVAFIGFGFHTPNLASLGITGEGGWTSQDTKILFSASTGWEAMSNEWARRLGRKMDGGNGDHSSLSVIRQAVSLAGFR